MTEIQGEKGGICLYLDSRVDSTGTVGQLEYVNVSPVAEAFKALL